MSGEPAATSAPEGIKDTPTIASKDAAIAAILAEIPGSDAVERAAEKRRSSTAAEAAKLAELGLRNGAPVVVRHGNQRRSPGVLKITLALLGVMIAAFACFAAMLYSYYQRAIEPELQSLRVAVATRIMPQELESSALLTSTRAELGAAQTDLSKAHTQIASLQKQITALQDKQDIADDRLAKFAEHMQTVLTSGNGKPAEASTGLSAAMQVASVVPSVSPTNQELWLLKERNRLTLYADQAISQGSSEAMTNLWRSLDDPELDKLREGTQAEIIRVQNYYTHLSRLPPEYRLPVRDLFKDDPALRSESDLRPPQLIKLLLDQKQPVEVRVRSAYVLGGQRNEAVAKALIESMKLDPVLDVVKEAQRTLAEDYGMRVPPLHLRAAEEWWKARTAGK